MDAVAPPAGWVLLSPPRSPLRGGRYEDVSRDSAEAPADTIARPGALEAYAAARSCLSSQLSAMDADMTGLETAALHTLRSAVDQYHQLIVAAGREPAAAAAPRPRPAVAERIKAAVLSDRTNGRRTAGGARRPKPAARRRAAPPPLPEPEPQPEPQPEPEPEPQPQPQLQRRRTAGGFDADCAPPPPAPCQSGVPRAGGY